MHESLCSALRHLTGLPLTGLPLTLYLHGLLPKIRGTCHPFVVLDAWLGWSGQQFCLVHTHHQLVVGQEWSVQHYCLVHAHH